MRKYKDRNNSDILRFRSVFEKAVTTVHRLLGAAAFRIADADGNTIEPIVNRALFDAQMLASLWTTSSPEHVDIVRVRKELSSLFADESFLDAIQRATGDRARTLKRIRETVGALTQARVGIDVPYDLSR